MTLNLPTSRKSGPDIFLIALNETIKPLLINYKIKAC